MESLKRRPRRLALGFYSFCLLLFSFCAYYIHFITRVKLSRPIDDLPFSESLASGDVEKKLLNTNSRNIRIKNPDDNKSLPIFKKTSHNLKYMLESLRIGFIQRLSNIDSTKWNNRDDSASPFLCNVSRKQVFTSNHLAIGVNDKDRQNVAMLKKDEDRQSLKDSLERPSNTLIPNNKTINETDQDITTTSEFSVDTSCAKAKAKLILLWTPFFGNWKYMSSSSFTRCKDCSNCLVTTNRSKLLESDAVIFHIRDMSLAELPTIRLPQQRWIFYCLESPPYSDFPGMQFMHQMFNWTMTYRLDSDIVIKYGSVKEIHPKQAVDKIVLHEVWCQKTRSLVWMSSHCPTYGAREEYVNQLKKYIDVDVFGSCGQLHCPKDSTAQCLTRFAMMYKFFLAFENSICKDYVTEKFFRTLSYDIVPVVFGGASYRKMAPPGSYIDALSFKSPKHLAYFLAGVGKDFHLYSSYFEWRKNFEVTLNNPSRCILCSLLHNKNSNQKIYGDLRKWWVQDGQCRIWKRQRQ